MVRGQGIKPNLSVRMDREILHQARVAAVIRRMTLGMWLEEAVLEKVAREQGQTEDRDESRNLRKGKH